MASFEERIREARQATERRDLTGALVAWHSIAEDFPDQPDGFVWKAETLILMGRLEEADALLATVTTRFTDHLYAAANRARIAAFRQDWSEALMRWGAVREKFPDSPMPYVGQGEIFLNLGQLELAEIAFSKAVALAAALPLYEWAAIGYANVASRRSDWKAASERWEIVRTRFPKFVTAWLKSAEALDNLGRIEESQAILQQARDMFPEATALRNVSNGAWSQETRPAIWSKARPLSRRSTLSAYVSIFNDWDILECSLRSIAPMIDELVVVDGAYEWLAPYFNSIGCPPARSDDRVYDILESAGIPYRVISNIWENEAQKRAAGYEACRSRFICRVDADEIIFPDHELLELFLKQGVGAAEMEMPLYVSPGRIVAPRMGPLPRNGFLFDSDKIDAADHLNYLWLVPPQPQAADAQRQLFPEPVAFNAHLTLWRTPSTALGRAAFYALNYVRHEGAPWFPDLRSKPLEDMTELFRHIPANIFQDTLKGSPIVAGYNELNGLAIAQSPLAQADEQGFYGLYDNFLRSHALENAELTRSGRYILGQTCIDLTSPEALAAISTAASISLRFSEQCRAARVYLQYLLIDEPWEMIREIEARIQGHRLTFDIPHDPSQFLRRTLKLEVWFQGPNPVQRFIVER